MNINVQRTNSSLCWGVAIASVIFLIACSSDDDNSNENNSGGVGERLESVDTGSVTETATTHKEVIAQYVRMAHAAYSDSLTAAEVLKTAVEGFLADPTESNLNAAKAAYKMARIPYQQSEIMRWDSAITVGKNLDQDGGPSSVDSWEGDVNAWPLDENHIVDIIAGDEALTVENLRTLGPDDDENTDDEANVTIGVHAVEFMLWGADNNGIGPGAGERPASDYASENCADHLCERRSQYLQVVTDLLVSDLTDMVAEWSPAAVTTEGTLAYNFLNSNLALDYIWGSMHTMASDELSSARMNIALITGDTEEEHDCFSDLSHLAIFYNFIGIRNAFIGDYGDVNGPGIGDLVREADEITYSQVIETLDAIEVNMQALLELGEREENPIHFDQIVGQGDDGAERAIALAAIQGLIEFSDDELTQVRELLSLSELEIGGDGD